MKILLRQRWGLGNQLFQYAAALYFAKKYSAEFEVISEPEKSAQSFGHPRPCLLSKYAIPVPVRGLQTRDRLLCTAASHGLLPYPLFRTKLYHQRKSSVWTFEPDLPIEPTTRTIYIVGHWEAHQFSQALEPELRQHLVLRDPPRDRNAEVLSQIQQCPIPVSLHVRHGDYAIDKGGADALPMSYFHTAIEVLRNRLPNPTFFVFSDDITYARENLPNAAEMIFVDHNDQWNAHEDLRLMSACHHHIIANSTFSWWGAWLNSRPDKLVIAPEGWRPSFKFPNPDVLPPDWQCIQVNR